MRCCLNPLFIGCFHACENITLPIKAIADGLYCLVVQEGEYESKQCVEFVAGDILIFKNNYKEIAVFVGHLYLPNGDLAEFANGTDIHNCIKFTNHL